MLASGTAATMTALLEWLQARIAADEAWATVAVPTAHFQETNFGRLVTVVGRKQIAECKSKDRLIDLAFQMGALVDGEWGCCHRADVLRLGYQPAEFPGDTDDPLPARCQGVATVLPFLRVLAAPYADRDGYRQEWAVD